MSYIFSHIFIPLAVLFIFSGKLNLDKRNIIILGFFGVLPDLDVIFFHRMTFHNILFVTIIPILIFIFIRNKEIAGIIFFYLLSHLILDTFNGGTATLYPFYDGIYFINVEIISSFDINSIEYILNYGIKGDFVNYVSKAGKGYGIVSSENFGIIILVLIIILWSFIAKKRNINE